MSKRKRYARKVNQTKEAATASIIKISAPLPKRCDGEGNKKAPVSGRWHVCIFFVKKKILPPSQKVSSPFGSRVISWWTASAGLMPWLTMAFTVRTMGMSTW